MDEERGQRKGEGGMRGLEDLCEGVGGRKGLLAEQGFYFSYPLLKSSLMFLMPPPILKPCYNLPVLSFKVEFQRFG